jgi:Protein of unknown function (DUF2889)
MGRFRRRIIIQYRALGQGGETRAALEDDFHHFRVVLRHEVEQLVHIHGQALRHPYSLCPGALGQLPQLLGMRLDAVANAVTRATDATTQCTHLLDLAGLGLAAAARRDTHRQYDIDVPDRVNGQTTATLQRDGLPLLAWQVQDSTITGPAPYAGRSLHQGLARWALQTLSVGDAEAALALRRCVMISLGRHKPLDTWVHAVASGHCYAQQPVRAEQALRMVGSTWDFSGRADDLCADDTAWLAGADDPSGD